MVHKRLFFILTVFFLLVIIAGNFLEVSLESATPPNMMLVIDPAPVADVFADSGAGQAIALTVDSIQGENDQSCYIVIEPIPTGKNKPPIGDVPPIVLHCQPDGDSLEGAEWLRQNVSPSTTLLSTHYSGSYYTGSQLWLTTSHSEGCTDGSQYQIPDLGKWNDITSSVEANTSAGCHSTTLYDYSGYSGAQITATPALGTLGAMDNAANSVKIRP